MDNRLPRQAPWWIGLCAGLATVLFLPQLFAGSFPALYGTVAGLLLLAVWKFPGNRRVACGLAAMLAILAVLSLCPAVLAEGRAALAALQANSVPALIDGRETVKIWLLTQGCSLYPDMAGYPYLVTLYTPIYHSLAALVALAATAGDVITAGHVVSYAGWLGLALVMAAIIRRQSASRIMAAVVPLAFLTGPYLAGYMLHIRPDLLAWCLAFGAVGLFAAKAGAGPSRAWPVAAALAMTAALLTKQQTLAVACGLITVCLVQRTHFGLCLRFAGLVGGLGLAAAAALYWLTDGTFLLHTTWYPARLAADPSITNLDNAWPRLAAFCRVYWGLLALFALALADALRRRTLHLLDWLVLVHGPFLVKLVSTWGADENYFIGLIGLITLRVGVFLGTLSASGPRQAAPALALLVLLLPAKPLPWSDPAAGKEATAVWEQEALGQASGNQDTLINAEGAAPLLAANGSRLFFFDATETQFFEKVGLWSFRDSQMAKDIARRRFPVIILNPTFLDPQLLRAVQNTYALARQLPGYAIYAPKTGVVQVLADVLASADDGQSVRLLRAENLETGTGFGARFTGRRPDGAAGPGEAVYAVSAPFVVQKAGLTLFPKVAVLGPDSFIEAAWSADGATYHPFVRYDGSAADNATNLFEPRLEATFSPNTASFFIRLTLSGAAKLWTGDSAPLLVTLE